jgi:hypothetical protein
MHKLASHLCHSPNLCTNPTNKHFSMHTHHPVLCPSASACMQLAGHAKAAQSRQQQHKHSKLASHTGTPCCAARATDPPCCTTVPTCPSKLHRHEPAASTLSATQPDPYARSSTHTHTQQRPPPAAAPPQRSASPPRHYFAVQSHPASFTTSEARP